MSPRSSGIRDGKSRRSVLGRMPLSDWRCDELIAKSVYGVQIARGTRVVGDGTPDAAHMDVNGSRIAVEIKSPDGLDQLVAREDAAFVARQQPQHVEFARLEAHVPAADSHFALLRIDLDFADSAARCRFRRRCARASRYGADARDKFARGERLDDVIVCAELKTDDTVDFGAARCEEENGRVRFFTQLPADFEAVETRQTYVEYDDVRRAPARAA